MNKPEHGSEIHFIAPRASPAAAINTAVMFHKKRTCEGISEGIRLTVSAEYGLVCGRSVGEEGQQALMKSPPLSQPGWEVGAGVLVSTQESLLS